MMDLHIVPAADEKCFLPSSEVIQTSQAVGSRNGMERVSQNEWIPLNFVPSSRKQKNPKIPSWIENSDFL